MLLYFLGFFILLGCEEFLLLLEDLKNELKMVVVNGMDVIYYFKKVYGLCKFKYSIYIEF